MQLIRNLCLALTLTGLIALPALAGDAQPAEKKAKPYPLKTCVVTGEKLGEMGDPYVFTHEGQEIKLCCKGCVKKFNADPAKYMKKLTEEQQKAK